MTLKVKNPQFWVDFYDILDLCIKLNMNDFLFNKKKIVAQNFENFDKKSQNFENFWKK